MNKSFSSINNLTLIPVLLFLFLIISILLVWTYPNYSTQTLNIEINEKNTIALTEPNFGIQSTINKYNSKNQTGYDCEIKKLDFEPSCRLEIWIGNSKTKGIDLSYFEKMTINGTYKTPTSLDSLRISLRNYENNLTSTDTHNHTHTHTETDKHYKFNLVEILSSEVKNPIEVNLKSLIVPNWWLTTVRDQNIKPEVDLTNISMIEISTGLQAKPGLYQLRVSSLELSRNIISIEQLYEYLFIFWCCFIIFSIIKVTIYLWLKIKQKTIDENDLIDINNSLSKHSKQLELINKTDELTMVLNRIGMKDKLMESLNNNWFPMAVVMIDIDFFKKINDTFGHQLGDNVLIELGKILNKFTQSKESVCRFGGEEFIILLPKNNVYTLKGRLEDLRKEIQDADMGVPQSVTISIGAAYCDDKSGFKSLVEQSDKALYQAKEQGRNTVIFYKQVDDSTQSPF
ncbi:MAG: GGDEF domain-containing protein [Saccharospirillaceae bacterium]|nr:GGDEF domain-containing protein [Pseudomonadales bacterium]NRB79015.1 GGDEF domain-containing protein [Saccharospirillaceae bacterium]